MANFVRVAGTREIPAGQGKAVEVNGKQIAVFNCEGAFYAIDNTCKHQGGPLGERCHDCPVGRTSPDRVRDWIGRRRSWLFLDVRTRASHARTKFPNFHAGRNAIHLGAPDP